MRFGAEALCELGNARAAKQNSPVLRRFLLSPKEVRQIKKEKARQVTRAVKDQLRVLVKPPCGILFDHESRRSKDTTVPTSSYCKSNRMSAFLQKSGAKFTIAGA